ncbi:MAG: energy-coupling factor transporter transmembrane protein EcfT [Thermomicrobia bacterium]|nr:energy-coupling factor transporter transmembrane protein EcfT [Thermomicrobia bacterium]
MRRDPRAKLCLYCAAIVAALLTNAPRFLLGFVIVALVIVAVGRGLRRWLTMLSLLAPMLVMIGLFSAIGSRAGDAVAPVLKLLALGTISSAFFTSVTVDELGDALTLMRVPPGIAFILVGGLRYAPAMRESWAALGDARRARGAERPRGVRILAEQARMLTPAVVRALRTADAMAEAMESRGFGTPGATFMETYRLRGPDWLMIASSIAALALFIAWRL